MARKKDKPEEIDPGLAARRRLVSDKQVERTLAAGKGGKPSACDRVSTALPA
jgi:hypothetical protein